MVFRNDLSPFALRLVLGGHELGIRWYGLAYVAGLALAYAAFRRAIRDGLLKPKTDRALDRLFTASLVGVFAGGRLGFVLQSPVRLLRDPLFVFKVWEGGMAFFGGLVGVLLALGWVARKERLRLLDLTDVAAPVAMLGLGLGRLANFVNAELWGRPTGADWGVVYPKVDSLPRHPSELYEAASHFLAFALLTLLARRSRHSGLLSALFLILYGGLRFVTDFWRDEPLLGALNTGQWASLAVAVCGAALMLARPKAPAS